MEEMEKDRRLARRRMGWGAFSVIMIQGALLVAGTFFGGPMFAANIAATTPLLISLLWAEVALVGVYLGASLTEALKKK